MDQLTKDSLIAAFKRDRFAAANRMAVIDVDAGYAKTTMTVGEHHFNSVELVHGGALFSLAALAMMVAACSHGRLAVGISMNLACVRPCRGGKLVAEAREIARSRRLSTNLVDVTDEEGALIAQFQGTAFIKEEPFPQANA